MKNFLFLSLGLSCFATTVISAQRANLDREYFKVSYVDLPTDPIVDDAKRTFTSNSRKVYLSGFSRVADKGTLDIQFDFHGTKAGEVDIRKVKHEKKDDDGNVVETTYTYDVITSYTSTATVSVGNMESGENQSYPSSTGDDYVKPDFRTYGKASDYYNNNRYNIRDEFASRHRATLSNQFNHRINNKYGYVPVSSERSEYFWVIATKKHPEFERHQEAYESIKSIFDKMEYDRPVSGIATELQPYIDYFTDVAVRFNEDDKKHRKVRYASYYNIAKMYLFLDRPSKAKEYADKLIANDYDKKDGKRLIAKADALINDFKKNQIKTRHFEVLTEDLSDEPEVLQVAITTEPTKEIEKAVAFLITAANDTVQTSLAIDGLAKRSDMIQVFDESGHPAEVAAQNSRKIVLTTGESYEVAKFKSAVASDNGATFRFVKTVYSGSNVSLYEHMGKEYVFRFSGGEGISTMDKDFVFGFDQKLASFCADCEALKAKVFDSEFSNTKEGLLAFSQEFDGCAKAK